MSERPVLVVGAGPTGLSASYHLGKDALLIEREDRVGGWCRSIESRGFTFDLAGHIMFSNDPYVHELYTKLLGDNVHWQDREAWIYSKGVYTRYPFQGSLYGLPADVIKECLMGAIEARYGDWRSTLAAAAAAAANGNGNGASANGHAHGGGAMAHANGNGSTHANGDGNGLLAHGNGNGVHAGAIGNGHAAEPKNRLAACASDRIQDCCADGILEAEAKLVAASSGHGAEGPSKEPANFEEFIYRVWGAGIAKHFAVPYNRKLWAVPLREMETSWLGGRVPMPDLGEMIEGALSPSSRPMGPNARFGYPLRGGFQALMNGFLPLLASEPRLGVGLRALSPRDHRAELSDGTKVSYDALVSTIPLPDLIRIIGDEAPAAIREAAAGLRRVSVRCVNLGIGRANLTDKHWIYYPEETVFHRIFVQGNASPGCNPDGGFALTCEITYSEHKPLPCEGDALIQRCIEDCRSVGIIGKDDPVWTAFECDLPYAYVVYDHSRAQRVRTIRSWLEQHEVFLAGRYSEWEYYNSDHAFLAGRRAAETVRARREAQAPGRVESQIRT